MAQPKPPAAAEPNPSASGHWWLGAVILPFLFFGMGVLLAFSTPPNQNDWIGGGFFVRILVCLLLGCVLSVILTVVSFARKEQNAIFALLVGLPSLCFSIYVVAAMIQSGGNRRIDAEQRAASYKHEKENRALSQEWQEKFRREPDLIINDEFWLRQKKHGAGCRPRPPLALEGPLGLSHRAGPGLHHPEFFHRLLGLARPKQPHPG